MGEARFRVNGKTSSGDNLGYVFATLRALFSIYAGYVFHKRAEKPKTLNYVRLVSTSLLWPASARVKQQVIPWNGDKVEEPRIIESQDAEHW